MLMALTNTQGVYQPFGNGSYELRFDGTSLTPTLGVSENSWVI
jgi:hypothetical protein